MFSAVEMLQFQVILHVFTLSSLSPLTDHCLYLPILTSVTQSLERVGETRSKNISVREFSQNQPSHSQTTLDSASNKSCFRNKRNRGIIILPAIQFQTTIKTVNEKNKLIQQEKLNHILLKTKPHLIFKSNLLPNLLMAKSKPLFTK